MSHKKITALCLHDLSAAFDTIDHSILVHRLSTWFSLSGTFLSWFKSNLSSRYIAVNINVSLLALLPLHQGVPQGSLLGFSSFHSLHHSAQLSNLWLICHHDTEFFISFSANDFSQNISWTTIGTISTWVSTNLLSLNQSKTEFLLIGLPKKLSKWAHSSHTFQFHYYSFLTLSRACKVFKIKTSHTLLLRRFYVECMVIIRCYLCCFYVSS